MTLLDQVRERLDYLSARVRSEAASLSLGFFGAVKSVLPIIPELMAVLQTTPEAGAVKKAAALSFLSELYSEHIAKIDLPGPFDWLLHRLAKKFMLVAADKLIDEWFDFLSSPTALAVVATFQPPSGPTVVEP